MNEHNLVVVDSSVMIKLFVDEKDRSEALALFDYLNQNDIKIIAPQLLITETLNVCLAKEVAHWKVIQLWESFINRGLVVINPETSILELACQIANQWDQKSGFPSFNDSLYHAIAISYNTTFITADKRHMTKVQQFGHIAELANWKAFYQ